MGRPEETLIRLDPPAMTFRESTPLGNGRLGAMVFGGTLAFPTSAGGTHRLSRS